MLFFFACSVIHYVLYKMIYVTYSVQYMVHSSAQNRLSVEYDISYKHYLNIIVCIRI